MTAHPLYATLLALLSVCSTAGAQVLRCEDTQGRVTYTNTTCPHDQRMQEVAPPLSAEEQARQDACRMKHAVSDESFLCLKG